MGSCLRTKRQRLTAPGCCGWSKDDGLEVFPLVRSGNLSFADRQRLRIRLECCREWLDSHQACLLRSSNNFKAACFNASGEAQGMVRLT